VRIFVKEVYLWSFLIFFSKHLTTRIHTNRKPKTTNQQQKGRNWPDEILVKTLINWVILFQ
jgi:hypothetical protein